MVTRTRTKGGYAPLTGRIFGGPLGAPTAFVDQTVQVGFTSTITDVSTPNFLARRAKGEIINNPMTIRSIDQRDELATTSWKYLNSGRPWEDGGTRPLAFFPAGLSATDIALPSNDALLIAEAVNKANANVQPNYAMLAVSLAELDKTIMMFRDVGTTAKAFMNAMLVAANAVRRTWNPGKRNSRKAQKEAMQAIASIWMQYRYGWLPTYMDLQGAIKAFQEPKKERQTSRAKSNSSSRSAGTKSSVYLGATYGYNFITERETTVRAGIMWEDTLSVDEMYSARLGLSFADALSTPYELLKLSWLLDWFLDVGDWLRAVTPKHGTNVLMSYTTVKRRVTSICGPAFITGGNAGVVTSCSGGSSFREEIETVRVASATPTIPGYGSGFSINRSIDAAMLAVQNLKGFLHVLSGKELIYERTGVKRR